MSANTRFYFRPGEGERIETVITLTPDSRSALCGHVQDPAGQPVPDALCMLFTVDEDETSKPAGQTFTDDTGQFIFGPLKPGSLYMLKLYKGDIQSRQVDTNF